MCINLITYKVTFWFIYYVYVIYFNETTVLLKAKAGEKKTDKNNF